MPRGNVKWFDPKKGFGFIIGPDQQDVFVHFSSIQTDGFRSLRDGQLVDYDLVNGSKGEHAINVRPVTDASADGQPASSDTAAPNSTSSNNESPDGQLRDGPPEAAFPPDAADAQLSGAANPRPL